MPKKSITADVPFAVQEWPANKVETWALDKIHPYEKNPRTHPAAQITLLAQLMKKRGVDQPIVVDEQGIILKGHGRRMAAIEAGFKEFPVVVHRGLSDTDKRALRLEDNQVALLAGYDDALLRIEVSELKLNGYEMPLLGFEDEQLTSIMNWGSPLSDLPTLPSGEQSSFQQVTFILHREQAALLLEAIKESKAMGPFENSQNENSNGNALARICEIFMAGNGDAEPRLDS